MRVRRSGPLTNNILSVLAAGAALLSGLRPVRAFSSIPARPRISEALPLPSRGTTTPSSPSSSSLETWLERNDAVLRSTIESDERGLRGLVPRGGEQEHLCRIPRGCIIVAGREPRRRNDDPVDALAATLLEEMESGADGHYSPYIRNMPGRDDVSLACIGGRWTDEQLAWLGHEPTMRHFGRLRSRRERFVEGNAGTSSSRELAGWAYDLVSSRALQGPFGRSGAVRCAALGTVASFAAAAMTPLLGDASDLQVSTLVETSIPLVTSASVLVSTLLRREPELAMLPWIDIANHKSKSKLYLEYGLLGDEIIFKRDAAATSSSRDANDEESPPAFANFDYGGAIEGAGNDKLLGVYGFVEDDNPNDALSIRVGTNAVLIGRNGVVRTSLREGCTLDEVRSAAQELRSNLLGLDRTIEDAENDDAVDSQRRRLAAQWRKAKILLIEEFLSRR